MIELIQNLNPATEYSFQTDGMDQNTYAEHVSTLVLLIDHTQEINPEFIDSALHDKLSVFEAVTTWFEGTDISIDIIPHADGKTGLIDLELYGIQTARRIVFAPDVKKGDLVNVYYSESSKAGAIWHTDVRTTLRNFFNQ